MMQPPQPPNQHRIQFELPANLNVVYANAAIVNHSHSEIIVDFLQIMPNDPRARVQARVTMTPANAKLFLKALENNLQRFEQTHGEISLPPPSLSLADQLFGSVKPDENRDEQDTPYE